MDEKKGLKKKKKYLIPELAIDKNTAKVDKAKPCFKKPILNNIIIIGKDTINEKKISGNCLIKIK